MPLHLVSSPRFAEHVTPAGHPERSERAQVFDEVAARWRARGGAVLDPRPATREELERVHAGHYIDGVARLAGRTVELDPDTYTCPATADTALLAAGGVCVAVEHTVKTRDPVLALVRPPGHHAEKDRAMGFCLFNNVAVGAALGDALGMTRVAVMDFDVHHGNGTQWMFYADPSVLYISTHQFPYYPGTGAHDEVGKGAGTGFTVNLPIEAGATDADYDLVFREAVIPVLDQFAPDLLMVSAGFDAHHRDPLAMMRVSTEGFASMIGRLHAFASQRCEGRLVVCTEGGYDLQALGDGLETTVELLEQPSRVPAPIHGDSARGRETLERMRAVLRTHWEL
jgi:acetoin utilization deacetylase AcuC-like enzyme